MRRLLTPVLSPEHGAYIVLVASFLVGVIGAGDWTVSTTVALVSIFCGFQAQFPVMQMLRRGVVGRLLVWAAIYGVLAVAAGLWLVVRTPVLLRIVWVVIVVFAAAIALGAVRQYKSLGQELVVFGGLTLAAPWSETATQGFMSHHALGVWAILTLAFWGAVFAVRIRSRGPDHRITTVVYSLVAIVLAIILATTAVTPWRSLWLLGPSFARLGVVLARQSWWQGLNIRHVGFIETGVALLTVGCAVLI